tara:strand:+ start:8053 stop:8541 length:489 start_codon:yes stop_codon:yes gene_type:complete
MKTIIPYVAILAMGCSPAMTSQTDLPLPLAPSSAEISKLMVENTKEQCLDVFCTGSLYTKFLNLEGRKYEINLLDAPPFINVPAAHIREAYSRLTIDTCTTNSMYADCEPSRRWLVEDNTENWQCYDFTKNSEKGTQCKSVDRQDVIMRGKLLQAIKLDLAK